MNKEIELHEKNGDTGSMHFKYENGKYIQMNEGEKVYSSIIKSRRNPFFIFVLPGVVLVSLLLFIILPAESFSEYQNITTLIANRTFVAIFFLLPGFASIVLLMGMLGSFIYGCATGHFKIFKKCTTYWLFALAIFIIAIGRTKHGGSQTGVYYHFLYDENTGFTGFDKNIFFSFIKYLWKLRIF